MAERPVPAVFPEVKPSEHLGTNRVVRPVFGNHLVFEKMDTAYEQFMKSARTGAVLPNSHAWPEQTTKELLALRPSMISKDGAVFNYPFDRKYIPYIVGPETWFFSPGDIFELRNQGKDLFMVDADLPILPYIKFDTAGMSKKDLLARELVEYGYWRYYYDVTGYPMDKGLNRVRYTMPEVEKAMENDEKKKELLDAFTKEAAVSIFVGPILNGLLMQELFNREDRPISRRRLIIGSVGAMMMVNKARIWAGLFADFPQVDMEKYLTRPYFWPASFWSAKLTKEIDFSNLPFIDEEDKKILNLRNALITMKMNDAGEMIPAHEQSSGPRVPILGSSHKDVDLWNDEAMQEQIVSGVFDHVFDHIDRLLAEDPHFASLKGEDASIIGQFIEMFGAAMIWRVKERPSVLNQDTIRDAIVPEKPFISSRIRSAVIRVWQNRKRVT